MHINWPKTLKDDLLEKQTCSSTRKWCKNCEFRQKKKQRNRERKPQRAELRAETFLYVSSSKYEGLRLNTHLTHTQIHCKHTAPSLSQTCTTTTLWHQPSLRFHPWVSHVPSIVSCSFHHHRHHHHRPSGGSLLHQRGGHYHHHHNINTTLSAYPTTIKLYYVVLTSFGRLSLDRTPQITTLKYCTSLNASVSSWQMNCSFSLNRWGPPPPLP